METTDNVKATNEAKNTNKTKAKSSIEVWKAKEFYGRVRELVTLEDGLVNHRLTWFITLQGFLYAGYGVLLQALAQSQSSPPAGTPNMFMEFFQDTPLIISFVGFFSAFIALLGVTAAFRAIRTHVAQLEDFKPFLDEDGLPIFPKPIGESQTSAMGAIAAMGVAWLASLPWPLLGHWETVWRWFGWIASFLVFMAALWYVFYYSPASTKQSDAVPRKPIAAS